MFFNHPCAYNSFMTNRKNYQRPIIQETCPAERRLNMLSIGVDIGSVSVKVVSIDKSGRIVRSEYIRHKGKPLQVAGDLLDEFSTGKGITFVAATGTGAKEFASAVGASFINEIVALASGFSHLYPDTGSVIDIGGEDSKLITLEKNGRDGALRLKDFSMNALCAAGTGAFLDQQASRLRFTIEEFSEMALKSVNPPRIAGRCTVFAKSDMIHLQQIATPDYEIVAGLCYALARSFKGSVAKGRDVVAPVAFVGGVAANAGMRRALKDVFSLDSDKFFVPEQFMFMGAIGAVYAVMNDPGLKQPFTGVAALATHQAYNLKEEAHEVLAISPENVCVHCDMRRLNGRMEVYLGVDVGSISTNLVVIDKERNVITKRYLMTEGRPIEAVKRGLAEIGEEVGSEIEIIGAGTTGSGRYLTADFIGADIVRNEITAQAEAAINIDPEVDTVFEIGGQDSKYISIDNGVITDFEMNKACAAGTGSFLEEQAERLGVSIKGEFGNLALGAQRPVKMGERCTVFIESDVVHQQQSGAKIDDIAGGLCYSIVANYLNKVVGDRRIGKKIFFQGGTAFNQGVVAAFEKTLKGKYIKVPPHHDVTGAIGVAILAMKEHTWTKSSFKGFDLSKRPYSIDTFECKGCENLCEIRKVNVENESPLFYGSRCEKYDVVRRTRDTAVPDLFALRDELLHNTYDRIIDGEPIGIPKIMSMWELLPFWKAFLTEIGFAPVLSDPTNKKIIREGVETIVAETCFPVKVAHGHVLNLINRGMKHLFIPSVINMRRLPNSASKSFACPYAQSIPYTLRASIDFEAQGVKLNTPIIFFANGQEMALQNLIAFGKQIGRSRRDVRKAFAVALSAQETFYRKSRQAGLDMLTGLKDDEKALIILGRPYNSTDPGANLNIHKKLADLGIRSLPIDMLPGVEGVEADDDLESMYWGYGQRILRGAKVIKERGNLFPVYLTNFGCGPDSFISHFFKRVTGDKPFLQLEIDEHSADAGMITRLEAFLDSVGNGKRKCVAKASISPQYKKNKQKRKLYIPSMSDHSIGMAAAFRACGVDAAVLDESDEETLYYGRKYTSGKECYPCILTTGDMVKALKKKDLDPDRTAFFMPSGNGPCRFGQYNRFQRMVLDEMGFDHVPIYSPNQDDGIYEDLDMVGNQFSRQGWKAVVGIDLLTKMLHEVRPYERNQGETDKVYTEELAAFSAAIESGNGGIPDCLTGARRRFLSVERHDTRKPIVGIVGEFYVRSNSFSNGYLVRKVEEFGGQVWLAPVSEWVSYLTYLTGHRKGAGRMKPVDLLKHFLVEHIQHKEEHSMEEIFKEYLQYGKEPNVKDIVSKGNLYVDESFTGEAILSVGKAVDFIDKGVSGIINAIPFTCMPGTIAGALLRLVQKKYDIPIITIAYDGQGLTNITTRLEAFMYQVREQAKRKEVMGRELQITSHELCAERFR
jgi:predicted CoA-substrate-specific enzyme activase